MAMNKEFTDLIQEFLTDGIISAKERAVLLKKAQKLGIDVEEANLYIDAQQQKEDIKVALAEKKKKGKTCPFCGGPITDLTDKCPHIGCGKPITPEATRELQEILDNLEDALVSMKSWEDFDKNKAIVERYERKARMYYSNHPKIKTLLAEVEEEKVKAETKFKSIRRKETVTSIIESIIENKRVWSALAIVIGIIIIAFNLDSSDLDSDSVSDRGLSTCLFIVGLFFVLGGVGGLFSDES